MIEILKCESMGNFLVSLIGDDGSWIASGFATKERIEQYKEGFRRVKIVAEKSVFKELGLLRPEEIKEK